MKVSNDKGVTLIVLIITIIILSILTSVGVVILGNYFNKAEDTIGDVNSQIVKQKNDEVQIKETWENIPGKVVKSKTMPNTGIEFTVTTSNITRTSFRITSEGTNWDDDILTYTLTIEDDTVQIEEETKTGEKVYWDVTGLNPHTTYEFVVIAEDDKSQESLGSFEITLQNIGPSIIVNEDYIEGKTTTQFTIKMQATDEENDQLTYELFYGTAENGTYTSAGTETAASGEETSITKTELTEATTYWWYIEVTDALGAKTRSQKQQLNTN